MKNKKFLTTIISMILLIVMCFAFSTTVFAAENNNKTSQITTVDENENESIDNTKGTKALAAAIVVGIASAMGAIAMGIAIAKSAESIARQPEAAGKINSAMMLGLVFIETLIIYALIVAILIIFVL